MYNTYPSTFSEAILRLPFSKSTSMAGLLYGNQVNKGHTKRPKTK